ncbi:MAG: RNA polymerase sigma factor [bacterium]|nr:RNA polymerase sigma factor [bacterium]
MSTTIFPLQWTGFSFGDRLTLAKSAVMDYADFENYYHQYKHKIYSYLYYRSGRNRELAEDLASEVFLKALDKFESYREHQSFQAWIYAIAHNHLIDFFRKNKKTVDLEEVENLLESNADVDRPLEQRLASEQVMELLDHLSDSERELVLMRYHQGLSHQELAEILDRAEGNIRVMLHRALAKMKKYATHSLAAFLVFFLI